MAMSDCEKCWNTPCSCGWDYRIWTLEARIKLAAAVLGVKPEALLGAGAPEKHPMLEESAQRRNENHST